MATSVSHLSKGVLAGRGVVHANLQHGPRAAAIAITSRRLDAVAG